ncbi:MAG: hypothetical protein EP329_06195 [Deltaproteobacteria bacterium]|nr:MAG: hypothetical protein EP329_06195 [Deltaproteobacteria bacterium]
MIAPRLAALLSPLALLALGACGDDAKTVEPRPLPHVVCGPEAIPAGAGDGLAAALCRPGADPDDPPPIGTATFEYDATGRLDLVRFDDGGGEVYRATFSWNALTNQLEEIVEDTDGDGETDLRTTPSWSEDLLTDLITNDAEGTPTRFVSFGYDLGRLSDRDVTDGEGTPLTFESYTWHGYDLTHRMLSNGGGDPLELADYQSDEDGHLIGRVLVDGYGYHVGDTQWTWTDGRLASRTDLGPDATSVVGTVDYQYDAQGRLDSQHRTGDDGRDLRYEYDAQGRIDRVIISGPAYD